MLTDVQQKKLRHLFKVYDSNKNGQVEWVDFERIADNIAKQRGWKPGSAEYEAVMGHYKYGWSAAAPFISGEGMNIDSWFDYNDAMLQPGVYDAVVRQSAEAIFDAFDADGDQKVTLDEWKVFFKCYGIDEKVADECFPKYDLNGDGYVSRPELVDLVTQFYMSSDPNAAGNWLFGPV